MTIRSGSGRGRWLTALLMAGSLLATAAPASAQARARAGHPDTYRLAPGQRGHLPHLVAGTPGVFQLSATTAGARGPVVRVRARTGSAVSSLSVEHPAPPSGSFQVWTVPGIADASFRFRGRLRFDSADGLIGLALVTPDGQWYIVGAVPDQRGPRIDISSSASTWEGLKRTGTFNPAAGTWFWVEVDVRQQKSGKEWSVYAWEDGENEPNHPLLTANEHPDLKGADLQAGLWTSGSGNREADQLSLEVLAGVSLPAQTDAAWPMRVGPEADGGVHVEATVKGQREITTDHDQAVHFATPTEVETYRQAVATPAGCSRFRYNYYGAAPDYPGSQALLGLSPVDNDCDGLYDEDPPGNGDEDGDGLVDEDPRWETTLSWTSSDSELGQWSTGEVDGVYVYLIELCPFRIWVSYLYIDGPDWLLGVSQIVPEGGGLALRGHNASAVLYEMGYVALEPLTLDILESGTPLADGAWFGREVNLTASVTGAVGTPDVTATIDSSPYEVGSDFAEEGLHQIEMTAGDITGREASAQRSFGVDLTPPAFDQLAPAEGGLVGDVAVVISGQVSADATAVTVAGTPATLADPAGDWRAFTSAATPLAEGANTIALHAVDGVGHSTDLVLHIERDTLPPAVAIAAPADGTITGHDTIEVSGTASDAHLASVAVNGVGAALVGGQWTATVPLSSGSNTLTAVAADLFGHTAAAAVTVIRDATPPVITLYESGTQVSGPVLLGRPAVFTAQVQDDTTTTKTATIDGALYTLGTPYGVEGDHTLEVIATDEAGNQATANATFTVDLTPPVIQGLTPASGSVLDATTVDLAGQVSADTVSVSAGGVAGVLGAPAGDWRDFTAAGVPLATEGANAVSVEAVDGVGNTGSLAASYDRDTQPPQLDVTAPADGLVTRFATLNVTGTVSDAHLDAVTLDGSPVTPAGDGSFTGQLTLTEGAADVVVAATDTLGHTSTVSRGVTLDTHPPVITVTDGGSPLEDGLVTNQPVTPVVEVTDATEVTTEITLNGQPFTSGTPVPAEGSYLLAVTSTDAAGNQASAERTFRIDTTAPVLAGITPADGTVTATAQQTVTGTADDAVSVAVAGQQATLTSGVFTAAGITLAEGSNALAIVATDQAGNTTSTTLRLVLDTAVPTVSVSSPADGALLADASVTVTGTAADDHLQSVKVNGATAALAGGAFQAQVPLTEDGSHVLTAVATDAAGNTAQASITVERDTAPPQLTVSEPGAGAILGSGDVTVSGSATDPHLGAVTVGGQPAAVAGDGTFTTVLTLAEGSHTVTVTAADTLGNSVTVERTLTVDQSAPQVAITQPVAGAILDTDTVTVTGAASDAQGIDHVTVNGQPATLGEGGAFTMANLTLAEGAGTVTARAFDPAGNSGTASVSVAVDTTPPEVASLVPADGTSGVPPSVSLRVRFTEPVDPATLAGAVTLSQGENPAAVTLLPQGDGSSVLVTPASALADNTAYVLAVATSVTDRAGHTLTTAASSSFTTADTAAPAEPQVDAPPSPACFASLSLTGTAEPDATVEASGGVQPASATVAADGSWSLDLVPTVVSGAVRVSLTAVDAAGNRSQTTPLTVERDCEPPHVVSAVFDGNVTIDVQLSEPPAEATVTAGTTVTLDGVSGPLPFTIEIAGTRVRLTLAAPPPVGEQPLTLGLTSGITDPAGNALAPYTTVLVGDSGATLVAGEAFDDERSLPLAGAEAALVVDGDPVTDPLTVTTDGRGRYQLPVTSSPVVVRLDAPGRLPAWRRVVPVAGAATVLFDVRLVAAAEPQQLTGAAQLTAGAAELTVDAGAVPAEGVEVSLTSVSEQGLPSLLPLGWAPLAAAHVGVPDGFAFDPAAVLTFDVGAVSNAVVARFDETSLNWIAAADGATIDVTGPGAWAVVVPDPDPTSPGVAVPGSPLPAAGSVEPEGPSAELALDPPVILPMEVSQASVTVTFDNAVPSGLPIEARLDEALHLVGGALLVQPPAATDLVLYRRDAGMVASFGLGASQAARSLALEQGEKDIHIRELPQTVRTESLVGPAGGSVLTADGFGLDVPPAALDHTVGVELTPYATDTLPAPLPAGLTPVAAATLNLGGAQLATPATLSFPGAGLAAGQYLVLGPVEIQNQTVWRLIGVAELAGERLECRPDVVDGMSAPWVTEGGLYLVVTPDADPWALIWGTVLEVSGSGPAQHQCRVDASGGLTALTGVAAVYAIASPPGTVDLTATDLQLLNAGGLSLAATAGQQLPNTDIGLQIVAPVVTATNPEDGATKVSSTTPVTFDISEPLDPASVAADTVEVSVIVGTDPAQPWSGAVELSTDGTRITWTPDTNFPSASQVVVTLHATVHDLQGYPLNPGAGGDGTDFVLHFSVERFLLPTDVDPSKIQLYAPGRQGVPAGDSVIEGSAGAVPGNVYLYAEDLDRQAGATTVATEQDGSFTLPLAPWDGSDGVEVGDHLLLHILGSADIGDSLGVVPLSVWLNADGSGALVGADGGEVTTDDGITIDVPAGSLPDGTMVTATAVDPSTVLPAGSLPDFVTPHAAINLQLSADALAGLSLALPAGLTGASPPNDPTQDMILAAVVAIGGRQYPMMVGRAVWDAETSSYRTMPIDQAAASGIFSVGTLTAAGKTGVATASSTAHTMATTTADLGGCPALNGVLHDMTVMALESQQSLGFAAGDLGVGGAAVVTDGGFATVPDAAAQSNAFACPYDFILPVKVGEPFSLEVVDPDTGYQLWEGGFDAPPSGLFGLPDDRNIGAMETRLRPTAGDPFNLFSFKAANGSHPLADGISANLENGATTVTVAAGALADNTRLTLTNLKTGAATRGKVEAGGTSLPVPTQLGEPLMLAVEGILYSAELPVTVVFNRPVEKDEQRPADYIAMGSDDSIPLMTVDAAGTELTIEPQSAWAIGRHYLLVLRESLFTAFGDGQDNVSVELPFRVAEAHHGAPVDDQLIADSALEGDMLLLAERGAGLKAFDVSDPSSAVLRGTFNTVDGGVSAVTTDGFGQVAVMTGVPPQPIALRLLRLQDLESPGEAEQQASLAITQQEGASAGFLRAEVTAQTISFTPATAPQGITVTSENDSSTVTIPADLLTPGHPVVLSDGVTRRILASGYAPASGSLPLTVADGVTDTQPLILRIHAETILYAFAQAGRIVAAHITFAPADGALGLEAIAVRENEQVRNWLQTASGPCHVPGSADRVYYGRLALAPRVDDGNNAARPLLLSATPYAGLIGVSETGGTVAVAPSYVQCLRTNLGDDLADVASARVHWDDGSENTIVAVVGHRRIEILKIGDGADARPQYLTGADLPFQSYRVALALDPVARLVLVRDNAGHMAVYSFASKSSLQLVKQIDVPAGTGPLLADPDVGVAWVGATPVQYREPMVQLVTDSDGDGILEPVRYLQPLGVPEAPADAQGQRPPYLAKILVRAAGIPAGTNTVQVTIEGLGPGGAPLPDHGSQMLPTSATVKLYRELTDDRADPSRHTFISKRPILLIADERARTGVWKNLGNPQRAELTISDPVKGLYSLCRNCSRDLDGDEQQDIPWGIAAAHPVTPPIAMDPAAGSGPVEIASAGRMRVRLEDVGSTWLAGMDEQGLLLQTEATSVAWAPSPAVGQKPSGDVRPAAAPEAELSTGTVQLSRTDLTLPAPGIDVALSRAYSSGGISWGELGWGWSLDVGGRLRYLPNREVELRTADGVRYTFSKSGPGATAAKLTAVGTPLELTAAGDGGAVLWYPDGSLTKYDADGYPERTLDRLRTNSGHGSEIDYLWGADGNLLAINQINGLHTTDSKPRRITFAYNDKGLLESATDSTNREYSYQYDDHGRLTEAKIANIRLDPDETTGDHTVKETYSWTVSDSALPAYPSDAINALTRGVLLASVKDGAEPARTIFSVEYNGADNAPYLAQVVHHGEVQQTIAYSPGDKTATATGVAVAGSAQVEELEWDDVGRQVRDTVGTDNPATTLYHYADGNWDPLPVAVDLPTEGQNEITLEWWFQAHPGAPRSMWFNLASRARSPDSEGDPLTEVQAQTTSYEYKPGTNLVTQTTLPAGRVWKSDRDDWGSVTKVTDPEGRFVEIGRDPLGRIATRAPAGSSSYATTFEYDDGATGCGEVSAVHPPVGVMIGGDAESVSTTLTYDDRGNVVKASRPASRPSHGHSVTHGNVNKLGWVLDRWVDDRPTTSDAWPDAAERVRYTYDAGGRVTLEKHGSDLNYFTVAHETTESGLPKTETLKGYGFLNPSEQLTIQYSYGPMAGAPIATWPTPSDGFLRGVVHYETDRAVAVDYDERGRETARKLWDGAAWLTTSILYARSDDLPTTVTDPGSHSTYLTYDRMTRLIEAQDDLSRVHYRTYDGAGRLETEGLRDALGGTWRHRKLQYNGADQITEEHVARFVPPGNPAQAQDILTTYTYDADRGLLNRIDGPEGRVTEVANDSAGRPWQRTILDGPTTLTDIKTFYWPSGVAGEVIEQPADSGAGSPSEYSSRTEYDAAMRPVREIRPGGHVSTVTYDVLDHLSGRMDPSNDGPLLTQVTTSALGTSVQLQQSGRADKWLTYDLDGFQTEMTESGGAAFSATYDRAGRVKTQDLPGGVARTLFWNPDGTLDHTLLNDGTTITNGYDDARRLTGRTVVPGPGQHDLWPLSETFSYNALDLLTSALDDRGVSVGRSWTSTGDLREDTVTVGAHTFTTSADYDLNGAITKLTYPDGTEANIGRDALGRMEDLTVAGQVLWSGGYHGLRLGDTTQGALALNRKHSLEGLPAEVAGLVGGSQRYQLERQYAPTLRFTHEVRQTSFTADTAFGHDAAQRATTWRSQTSGLPQLPDAVLGGQGNAAQERLNRTFQPGGHDDLVNQTLVSGGQRVFQAFGIQLNDHRLTSAPGWSYAYDSLGARSTATSASSEVLTYEHDWSSRLLDISTADGSVARFTYDPLGRRVEATVNGVSTYRAPFGSQEVAAYVEDTNGDLQERKRLYWGDGVDHLLAYDWDSDLDGSLESRLYPLTDDKGTVQGVADADGTVVESYVYRPDGSFRIFGTDQTVPELLLARVRPAGGDRPAQRMELVFSEKVQLGDGTLELRDGSGSPIFDNADWSKSADGRRWWVDIDPPLVEGDSYTLYLTGLEDTTGNRMAVAQPIDESFTVPAETDELDLPLGGEGDILAVIDAQNTLVLVSGSPIDPASLSGASLSLMRNTTQVTGTLSLYDTAAGGSGDVPGYEGRILVWTPDDPSLYQPADYEATILLSLTDPAGHQIHAPPSGLTFSHAGEADIVWAKASETPPLSASTSSNDRFLHGRPYIQPLGLYDYRARFYEPSTSTFIEPDPLGPVDSPNLYQAFGFDGLNVRDPWGLAEVPEPRPCSLVEIGCDPNTATLQPDRETNNKRPGSSGESVFARAGATIAGRGTSGRYSDLVPENGVPKRQDRRRIEDALLQENSAGPTLFRLVVDDIIRRDILGQARTKSVVDETRDWPLWKKAIEEHTPLTFRKAEKLTTLFQYFTSFGSLTKEKGLFLGLKNVAEFKIMAERYDEEGRLKGTSTGASVFPLSVEFMERPYKWGEGPRLMPTPKIHFLGFSYNAREHARTFSWGFGKGTMGFSEEINLDRLARYTSSFEVPRLVEYARARWILWRLGNDTERSQK